MGGRQADCDAVRQWFGSPLSCSVLDAIRTGYPPCLQLFPRSERASCSGFCGMRAGWDDWGGEPWGGGAARLGRMQSAACSPVMHLVYCSLSVGLFCSPRLVLHVPWFDLAASLLRVWALDGMKLTKCWRRSCRGTRSILAAPAAMLCCRGQWPGLGISLTGPGSSGPNWVQSMHSDNQPKRSFEIIVAFVGLEASSQLRDMSI